MKRMLLPVLKKILFICLVVIAVLFVLNQCGCAKGTDEPSVPEPPGIELPSIELPSVELPSSKPVVCPPAHPVEKK